jgi:predicted ATPase
MGVLDRGVDDPCWTAHRLATAVARIQERAMQIESIEIRNYRVFRDARLTDLPRMAVVVGVNGSGKSTLFDALQLPRGSPNAERGAGRCSPGRVP